MTGIPVQREARVAILVDCDNVSPDILEHALRMAAQFGRVVMRRGYGNQATLAHKWQEALTRLAFTPCLQYQYAAGKNTADIALALDTLEAHFDGRADTFCIVTSDSDFAYLCRKLRERGAAVCVVGEPKTPDALRHASDHFFEWSRPVDKEEQVSPAMAAAAPNSEQVKKQEPPRQDASKPALKRRPLFVVDAVSLLVGDTPDGRVSLSPLGQYLRRTDPGFSSKTYGHSRLLDMLKTYDLLETSQDAAGNWKVGLAAPHGHERAEPALPEMAG
jgi:uncharacterized protein (TIGR00288 family)